MPLSFSLDHVGPLTRTVSDCASILQAIAGPDPLDPTTSRMPVPDYLASLERGIKGLRVAIPETHFQDAIDPAVRPFLDESIAVFRACGAEIVPVTLPKSIELAAPLGAFLLAVEGAASHSNWIRERFGGYGAAQYARMAPGLYYPATRYLEARNLRARVLSDFVAAAFETADLFHTPSVPILVPTIAESDLGGDPRFNEFVGRFTGYSRPFNYMGLPALCLPVGLDDRGLPVGFQLVGRPFDEALLLRAGRAYERESAWTQLTPRL